MYKYLCKSISVERPIVFLCGPYFDKNNPSDRRTILYEYLKENFNDQVISLIIDDFLTFENIQDPNINVQLLEEIFAAISNCTYIFLDSMSSASELGLFANHTNNNSLHVFLPFSSDILHNNVGFFVKNIVIDQNKDKIRLDYYRPKILKRAIATDYVIEHYEFLNDQIPSEIATRIKGEELHKGLKVKLIIEENNSIPHNFGVLHYIKNERELLLSLSIKTLFYMISNIAYDMFTRDQLKDKNYEKMSSENLIEIEKKIKSAILITLDINIFGFDFKKCELVIKTILEKEFHEIIKHILKFIILYHENKTRNKHYFLTSQDNFFMKYSNPVEVKGIEQFEFYRKDYDLIEEIISNKSKYYTKLEIKKNRKKRELYTYANEEEGRSAKLFHIYLRSSMESKFIYSTNSFAYQKGKSVVQCVEKHLRSVHFVKFDISHFFNSIDLDILSKIIMDIMKIDIEYIDHMKKILQVCTVNNQVPLGFNISPMLSEIYMVYFDNAISEYIKSNNLVYTRYADDILISSENRLDNTEVDDIYRTIEKHLKELKLKINKRKFYSVFLETEGSHFKYLGLNIVKTESSQNIITVGKKYKFSIAKRYLNYLNYDKNNPSLNDTRFYEARRIAGQISFVKQVEGLNGYWQIIDRIKKSTNGRVDIKTEKINF